MKGGFSTCYTVDVGRPSKYDTINLEQVEKLASYGLIDTEIADIVGISDKTLYNYENNFPEFLQAIQRGKDIADAQVVKSLYQRACGYSHPEDKIFCHEGQPVIVPTIKHYAPDTAACFIWLKNRRKEEWKDRREMAHSGSVSFNKFLTDACDRSKDNPE